MHTGRSRPRTRRGAADLHEDGDQQNEKPKQTQHASLPRAYLLQGDSRGHREGSVGRTTIGHISLRVEPHPAVLHPEVELLSTPIPPPAPMTLRRVGS